MTQAQKIIKYISIAFAIFLIVNIISLILFGLYQFANILGLTENEDINISEMQDVDGTLINDEIDTIKIELQTSNLSIKIGDSLKLSSNSNNISYKQDNGRLKIEEEEHSWFFNKQSSNLVLYIPEDMVFKKVEIETGAGEINIETLNTQKLSFKLGAGKAQVKSLSVIDKAKIEGGAGKLEILRGTINNLDLDMGVGKFVLNAKLTGKSNINAGIGSIDIGLIDGIENYTIKANKAIGSINVNGKDFTDKFEYGNGESYIKIDGGIGSINIK